jgi:hypothetical protein
MKKHGRQHDGGQEREPREVLASGTVSRIERCGCGSLYLTLGPVTMAVHPEAMMDLSETLAKAAAILTAAELSPAN